jgi:hypothetical protein
MAEADMNVQSMIRGAVALALAGAGVVGGGSSASAVDVLSAGPLEKVVTNPDLSCQALRSGDQVDAFYGTDACGTYIHVDGITYGPTVSAGGSTGAVNYTAVSQTPVSGDGSAANPFTVDTVVSSAVGGFSITQRDQYIVGQERWTTRVTVTNTGAPRTFDVYRGGDCYQANSDFGFGRITGTNPACISSGGRVQELQAITPGNTYIEAYYDTMWAAIGNGGLLPNTCECATEIDNAAAIGWQAALGTGASQSFDSAWFLSSPFVSFAPQRILDTRPDGVTVDGLFQRGGVIAAGQTLELQVGGRAGVAGDANSAILNVATLGSSGPGYLTIYPCGVNRPTASSVNYFPGVVRSVAVYGRLDATGRICIFALENTHVIVDVNGYQPNSSSAFTTLTPARLLETRGGGSTVDGLFNGIGRRVAGAVTELTVAGRGGVPADASAAILSVAGILPDGPGFITVWPCGAAMPTASNVNLNSVNDIVPNAVISRIGVGGKVCIFNPVGMDVIVDVSGFAPAGAQFNSVTPARLLDTRPTGSTIDDLFEGVGQIPALGTLELNVTGRGGVPAGAVAVALNVTVTGAAGPGFITVWPCGATRPASSNLNYNPGATTANLVMPGVGTGGRVCFYSLAATDLVVDVSGYFPA